ncbi:MAG TPA: hypothetical protein VFZ22_02415, partial [Pyrinomonadaceae bacterium]|nr:hypothetical protein [Pyrinomonadaceae bacterium]
VLRMAQTMACSLPPEPITSILFMICGRMLPPEQKECQDAPDLRRIYLSLLSENVRRVLSENVR